MKHLVKKSVSILLTVVMVVSLFTIIPFSASAGVNQALVDQLTTIYDGDESRARTDLSLLYDAGIIDEEGNMVSLDIREDGKTVELNSLAERIANNEHVGTLTVNGHEVPPEQIVSIQKVKAALELAKALDQNPEITDEHVDNLQKLLEGVVDGSIDLERAIEKGTLSPTGSSPDSNAVEIDADGFPTTKTSTGNVSVTEGQYTQPLINDSNYNESYSFTLRDAKNTTYYTESRYEGSGAGDTVVSMSRSGTKVTATLNRASALPVSFDWKVVGDGDGGSGTVTIPAGSTQASFNYTQPGSDWNGNCVYYIEADNLKNALFSNEKDVWALKVTYKRSDSVKYTQADQLVDTTSTQNNPFKTVVSTNGSGTWVYGRTTYDILPNAFSSNNTSAVKFTLVVRMDKPVTGKVTARWLSPYNFIFPSSVNAANISHATLANNDQLNYYQARYTKDFELIQDTSSTSPRYTFPMSMAAIGLGDFDGSDMAAIGFDNPPAYVFRMPEEYNAKIIGIGIEVDAPLTDVQVTDVSVPQGTYYSGQEVPVTLTFNEFMQVSGDATLKINGVDCPLVPGTGGIAKKMTFAYTVKDIDSGSIAVSTLSGSFKNGKGDDVTVSGMNGKSFGAAQGVNIISDVKRGGLDLENVKYGIDDGDSCDQIVTALVPFKSDANLNWVGSETVAVNNGNGVTMALPGYPSALIRDYVAGAYFSYDGGVTRYPAYVVRSTDGSEKPLALAARFAAPDNETVYLRKDKLELFTDVDIIADPTMYMCKWENMQTDSKGFAFTTATAKSAGYVCGWSYYVKGGVYFSEDEYISRGSVDYSSAVENGFLKLDDGYYVPLADHADHPERQYDVEILASEGFYSAAVNGAHLEDTKPLKLDYRISGRKHFSCKAAKYFTWKSSDNMVAKITTSVENGRNVATVTLPGYHGSADISLVVNNGGTSYEIFAGTLVIADGMTPFFNIPSFSKNRTTLTGTETNILFSSNLTLRNIDAGVDETKFSAELYDSSNAKIWSKDYISTLSNRVSHVTIPGDQLTAPGVYTVKLSGEYHGTGDALPSVMTDSTSLTVKQAPAKITLDKLENYYVTSSHVPSQLSYTVNNSNATVRYTIQRSGEAVSKMQTPSTAGVIPFSAGKPSGLKEVYTVTVYARNTDDEEWSVDSLLLTVYNEDILDVVVADVAPGAIGGTTGGTGESMNGKTVVMDNADKPQKYLTSSDYQLTFEDFTALRTDISLQKVISVNYGAGVWGMLSDRIQWESDNPDLVSANYEQGGMYSDIRNYSYTSYMPATDILLVGKGDTQDSVTVTATHANTGMKASVKVNAKTLKDKLYLFQFYPTTTTTVIYYNGNGVRRQLTSNEQGELAVYEPAGIASDVQTMSTYPDPDNNSNTDTYVGTVLQKNLASGERDVASLQLYACNNLRLRRINKVTLVFRNTDGTAYNGDVTIRGGVYKNDLYCPTATIKTDRAGEAHNGIDGITGHVSNGKLDLYFDPSTFRYDSSDDQALPGDNITYVLEYTTNDCRPGLVVIYSYSNYKGLIRDSNAVIQLKKFTGNTTSPQIITQTMQQYYDKNGNAVPTSYERDVIDYTEYIGLSRQVSQVKLTTEVALMNEPVVKDSNNYSTYKGDKAYSFAVCKPNGKEFTDALAAGGAQPRNAETDATLITNLKDYAGSTLFVFPFSTFAVMRGSYTMNDTSLTADGVTDGGSVETFTTENCRTVAKMAIYYGNQAVKNEALPFGVSNLSHQPDVSGPVREMGTEIKSDVQSKADIGSIFSSIDVNDMIQKGVIFLSGLTGKGDDKMMNMLILPTEDPATFRIMVFIGYNKRGQDSDEDKINVEFDPDQMYDDIEKFDEALNSMSKDDDDDDDDDGGEGSIEFNFYGTLTLDAHMGIADGDWDIRFAGGNIGANFAVGYEWSQNFMVGPVPILVSFGVGANADLELGFASIEDVREMLLDAALGVSLEAFAGVGFDLSIVAFQIGIFGEIGANVNFLSLTSTDQSGSVTMNNGTKLDIAGEIGLRMKVKFLLFEYSKTFCSTGFNWSKTWGKYDAILDAWENGSPAEIKGTTANGRAYKMMLYPTGTAMITVDDEGELESRDYLDQGVRLWNIGLPSTRTLFKSANSRGNALTDVQTNAYPYANPVFTDDGEMFLYLSDNNNAKDRQTVISYAVNNGVGYTDQGRLDLSDEVLMDSSISASGTGNNAFAAWVKQGQKPVKEKNDTSASYDELGIMLNSTEIYAGDYNGSAWNVTRLTDNTNADMAPVVASSGNRAIVAWRSLDASSMPESGADLDITAMFNVENSIRYRIYDGTDWTDAQIAYNGAAGTVNAIDAAMLDNGTALLTYTVRTGEDLTSTETFYTVVDMTGNALTTVRLTNDNAIDTNAQAVALGDQFVLGWYSEYGTNTTDGSAAHDVRMALVNANGSVDANFPESIGGEVSPIGSDFRFTQPAGNNDLNKLSIIWSQAADNDDSADNGKYALNAVRFYQQDGAFSVTAPTEISLTDKGFKIDHFDTYTDAAGIIHTLILGSDYSNITGLEVYDSIDMTNLPVQTNNSPYPNDQHLRILAQDTLSHIKLGSGGFAPAEIEVSADTDLTDLTLGLNLPIQFTVKNTGTEKIDHITISGAADKEFTDLNLLPNETTTLVVSYPVPEYSVQDVTFQVAPEGGDTKTVDVTLNRPDVGIAGMKLLREENGERDVQVTLANTSGIPLAGSGKTVKLALYKDSAHTQQLDLVTISSNSDLADIDAGFYSSTSTIDVAQLIGSAEEIPDSGVSIYAHAWVENADGTAVDELYPHDNDDVLFFHGLLTKNNGEILTDTCWIEKTNDGYTVNASIRNNSLKPQTVSNPVLILLDSEDKVIGQKPLTPESLTLNKEQQLSAQPVTFTADEVSGTPVSAQLGFVSTITFSAEGGKFNGEDQVTRQTDVFGKLSELPVPDELPPYKAAFIGWYSAPTGGEPVTLDNQFITDTTVYARYSKVDVSYLALSYNEAEQQVKREEKTVSGAEYREVSDSDSWQAGWYVLHKDYTAQSQITVNGDVNLILCDGATLNASGGIHLAEGSKLRVYGQTQGTGKLKAISRKNEQHAFGDGAIEGSGEFYLHGGEVEADSTATLNGGLEVQTVVVYGGKLTATAEMGAGIGSKYGSEFNGTVTIYGGDVTASARDGAGIGSAFSGKFSGTVAIYGGNVNTTGYYGSGIGSGQSGSFDGTVTINGGNVTATGNSGAGIGSGEDGSFDGTITINGGDVIATSTSGNGIGAGEGGSYNGTLKLGAGVGLLNGDGKALAAPADSEQTVTRRASVMKTGTAESKDPVSYMEKGTEKSCEEYDLFTDSTTALSDDLGDGWYVVSGTVTVPERISVSGDVKIILCDGAELIGEKGIALSEGNTLSIYSQKEGTGKLSVKSNHSKQAAIGTSDYEDRAGALKVYGGQIYATSSSSPPAVGDGNDKSGSLYVAGGKLVLANNRSNHALQIASATFENGMTAYQGSEPEPETTGSEVNEIEIENGDFRDAYVTIISASAGDPVPDPGMKIVPSVARLTREMADEMENLIADMPSDFEKIKEKFAEAWDGATSDNTYLIYNIERGSYLKAVRFNSFGDPEGSQTFFDLDELRSQINSGEVYYVTGLTQAPDSPGPGPGPGGNDGEWNVYSPNDGTIVADWMGSGFKPSQTLTVIAEGGPVTGQPYPASYNTATWTLGAPTFTYYRLSDPSDPNSGVMLSGAPSEKGVYSVEATVTVMSPRGPANCSTRKTFAIGYETLNITGATLKQRDYEQGNSTAEVTSVTFDKPGLQMGVDYEVTEVYVQDMAGENVPVTLTVKLLKGDYFLASSRYQTTMTINKVAYTGIKEATVKVSAAEGSFMQAELPIPNSSGATFTNNYSDVVSVNYYGGRYLGINTLTQITSTEPMTITIHYTSRTYEDFDFTLTLVPTSKKVQEFNVMGIPEKISVGDTGSSLYTHIFNGDGTVSYSVVPGYEEYIDINPVTGAITAKKAGTAYFFATASETDECAETSKYCQINLVEDPRPQQIITASDITASYGAADLKIDAKTSGNGALSYRVKSGYNVLYVDDNGNIKVYETGTAVITVTAEETDAFRSATKDVTVTINKGVYTGLKELTVPIGASQWSQTSVNMPFSYNDVRDAQVTNNYSDYIRIDAYGNSVNINTDAQIESTAPMTVTIHYTSVGYEDFDFTLNLIPVTKQIPYLRIWGAPETLEVGQTSGGLNDISNGGDGTISFSVLPGYEEYISIDPATGAITAKKPGKAYYCMTSSETDGYAENTVTMMITITGEEPAAYTVTWKNWNGNVLETDENVAAGTIPSYNGDTPIKGADDENTYTFSGWSPEIAAVTGDITYTAQFTAVPKEVKYTVTWKNWNGNVLETDENVAAGTTPSYNGDTPVKGADDEYTYTFSGWSPEIAAVTGNITYTATFENVKRSYTITWKNDDGSVIDTTTVEYGETPAHSDPVKENHTFLGWAPAITAVTGDAEYTATYSEDVKEYTVTWKNGDTVLKTVTVTNGETPSYDGETPTKAEDEDNLYAFEGWTPTVDGEGNITYTAAFTAIPKLFVGHSVSLGGDIGVNFFINPAAANFASASKAIVKFTWDGGGKDRTKEVDLKKLTPDDKGRYKVTCDVVAAQMAHKIHAEIYLDGEKLAQIDDFSVKDYAELIYKNPEKYDDKGKPEQLKALAKALLNYGAQAQIVFDSALIEKPDPAKTVEIVGQTDFSDVTVEKIQNAINEANPGKSASDLNEVASQLGAEYYTNSLIYLSKNTLRVYFTPVEGSMTMNNPNAYDGSVSDYYYYVDKANIAAAELDNLQKFTVSGTDFYFSALDYAIAVISSDKMNGKQKNLAKSLYLYNAAANAYFD